jgi:nucleoid-associated protein YgaU
VRIAAAVCATLLLLGSGCGKPVLRLADASLGDYYTDKELKKLSDEQRDEYCRELANQREIYVAQVADASEALDAIQLGAAARRAETDSLKALAARLEARLPEERARSRAAATDDRPGPETAPRSETYVVKPGDSLWRISGLAETLGRSTEWTRLHQANRDRIQDPDRIYPGQEIQIPR